jgi:hypothetical protein
MNLFLGMAIYVIVWWLAFFVMLPIGAQSHHEADEETVPGGARVLNEPRIGAHGTPVIFIDPKNSDGVLIELMETPRENAKPAAHG